MDYSNDVCMYMFSSGQSVRMDAALDGARLPIQTSDAFDKSCPLDLIFVLIRQEACGMTLLRSRLQQRP